MANFVSVRGWIECEHQEVETIKNIITEYGNETIRDKDSILFDKDTKLLYNQGWRFSSDEINWTAYIFYGADIREYCLSFIKNEVSMICSTNKEIEGLFFIDDENDNKICWKICNGKIIEGDISILFCSE